MSWSHVPGVIDAKNATAFAANVEVVGALADGGGDAGKGATRSILEGIPHDEVAGTHAADEEAWVERRYGAVVCRSHFFHSVRNARWRLSCSSKARRKDRVGLYSQKLRGIRSTRNMAILTQTAA